MNTNPSSNPSSIPSSASSTTASPGSRTTTGTNQLVTGLFPDRESAEAAYNVAQARGYAQEDFNLVMSKDTRQQHFSGDTAGGDTSLGSKAAEGAGIGGAIGGTVGAVLAAIAAVGTSLALPGLGLVIAGPLAAAVAGAGAGAASGGLIGALIGWNIPEERAQHYEEGLKNGGILMGVNVRNDDDAAYIENQWRQNRGQHIYH